MQTWMFVPLGAVRVSPGHTHAGLDPFRTESRQDTRSCTLFGQTIINESLRVFPLTRRWYNIVFILTGVKKEIEFIPQNVMKQLLSVFGLTFCVK